MKMALTKVELSSLPAGPNGIKERLPKAGDSTYILFIVDNDAATGQPWCPDVRAALPVVEKYFAQHPDLSISAASVGSRVEYVSSLFHLPQHLILTHVCMWRDPANKKWKTTWGIRAVPTLVKYTRAEESEEGILQAQLVELDAADEEKLEAFTKGV